MLLDEDVRPLLAEILRQRGYDAVHILDLERTGKTDAEQLEFAASQHRAILLTTFEISSSSIGSIGPLGMNISVYYFPIKLHCENYCKEHYVFWDATA